MATRRQYSGTAVETTTVALLTAGGATVDIVANTGWPSTPAVPFGVALAFDSVTLVEKCWATISGSTLTLTRGVDGTTAREHAAGTKIIHVITAVDADEANELAALATTFGKSLLDDANAAAGRTTLALGTLATQSGTFSGTSSGTNTGDNATNTLYSGLQAAIDLKAPIANPTFTGTVGGVTATMVGLGNVTNTSDANKPVSTAQQAALDLKLDDSQATAFGLSLLDDANAAAGRTTLELGTLATQSGTFSGTSSGTNTGDQTISDATITTTDITTNNATTVKHGFMPKGTGSTSTFFRSDMTQAAPTASVSITETEIDVGTTPVQEATVAVTDAGVTASSKILGGVAYKAPTGKDLDELEMDALEIKFEPGSGTFNVWIKGLEGYIADKFIIWYTFA